MGYYTVIVHKAEPEEGGFWAEVLELPGCMASGDSLEELEQDVKGAIETYIHIKQSHGEPVPEGQAESEGWRLAVAV